MAAFSAKLKEGWREWKWVGVGMGVGTLSFWQEQRCSPRRSRGELWVGMWDDMFKGIAGLTHSRYSASSFWLAHL